MRSRRGSRGPTTSWWRTPSSCWTTRNTSRSSSRRSCGSTRSAARSRGRREPRHGQGLGPPAAARHGQELLHLAHRPTREARRRDEERGGRAAAFRLAGELPAQLLIAFSRKHQGPDCFFQKISETRLLF